MACRGARLVGLLVAATLVRGAVPVSSAEWVGVGPEGGSVVGLVVDPADPLRAFAATGSGGVFRTADGGDTWRPASAGLPSRHLWALAMGGTRLYAATDAGVFVSTNGATTWEATPLSASYVGLLAVEPSDGRGAVVVAGGRAHVTHDGGATWSVVPLDGSSPLGVFTHVAFDPFDASTVYAARPGAYGNLCLGAAPDTILRSRDGGDTWAEAATGIVPATSMNCCLFPCTTQQTRVIRDVAADPHHRGILLALTTAEHAAYRSTDGGDSWAPFGVDSTMSAFVMVQYDPSTPGRLYALRRSAAAPLPDGNELARSDDGGQTWEPVAMPALDGAVISSLALVHGAAQRLLVATVGGVREGGVVRSLDGGQTWDAAQHGIAAIDVVTAVAYPRAPGSVAAGGFVTTDGGATWTPLALPGRVTALVVVDDSQTPTDLYAATVDAGLYSGHDFGAFGFTPRGLVFRARSLASEEGNGRRLYAALAPSAWCNLAVSNDGGNEWTYDLGAGFPSDALCTAEKNVVVAPGGSMGAFVGFETAGGVERSIDGGRTWRPARDGLPDTVRALLAVSGVHDTLLAGTPAGVFRTTDAGATWVPVAPGLETTDVRSLAIDPQRPAVIYAGTAGAGVFKSVYGTRWTRVGTGGDTLDVRALVVDPVVATRLFAGTIGGSVFRLVQEDCGDGVVHYAERVADEVGCELRPLTFDGFCGRGRFGKVAGRRLERVIGLLDRSYDPRVLRRMARLLRRVRAGVRRRAHAAHADQACLNALDARLVPAEVAIGDALAAPRNPCPGCPQARAGTSAIDSTSIVPGAASGSSRSPTTRGAASQRVEPRSTT